MDEKTAELREIFLDATGAETVTEDQEESPGTLADERDDGSERLRELIGAMQERYTFESELSIDELETVVRLFFEDSTDADIAAELDTTESTIFTARLDLHLVRERDRDAPFDLAALRKAIVEGDSIETVAERQEADLETVQRYRSIVETDLESTRANDRFRDEFRELLTDAELETRMARDAREDGLQEATEDIETDVSF